MDRSEVFTRFKREFDVEDARRRLANILRAFIGGVERSSGFANLKPCIDEIQRLSDVVSAMERAGASPTVVNRVKEARENLLKTVLRIYYMQRTVYLPSARFLAEVLTVGVIALLIFVESRSLTESLLQFGIISYFIVYLRSLTYALDTPFRQGERTQDDVSLFLLKDYQAELASDSILAAQM